MGTPATNERFCRAPAGNAYGVALTPAHVGPGASPARRAGEPVARQRDRGYPSVAGTVRAGLELHAQLARPG